VGDSLLGPREEIIGEWLRAVATEYRHQLAEHLVTQRSSNLPELGRRELDGAVLKYPHGPESQRIFSAFAESMVNIAGATVQAQGVIREDEHRPAKIFS